MIVNLQLVNKLKSKVWTSIEVLKLLKKVNKKQTKITVELIAKRKVICIRPTMPQEKSWKRKKKISRVKKVRSIQEERSCPYQKSLKKDFRTITGQYCNVNLRNNTNHLFSIFNKTFWAEVFTKRPLPSSPWKKTKVIGTRVKKFNEVREKNEQIKWRGRRIDWELFRKVRHHVYNSRKKRYCLRWNGRR